MVLNNLGHWLYSNMILCRKKRAVDLEPKFGLPVRILAKELNHSDPQFPSLQNEYNDPCLELLESNEPNIFLNLKDTKLRHVSGPSQVIFSQAQNLKAPHVHILVCSCHLGLSSKVTVLTAASTDHPTQPITCSCTTVLCSLHSARSEIIFFIYFFCFVCLWPIFPPQLPKR